MPTHRKIRRFGWHPSLPDERDAMFAWQPDPDVLALAPPHADLTTSPNYFPVWDQSDLGCHDERTEVLTDRGWTAWPDYDGKTPIGTMSPVTHELEFQEPVALHAYEYKGEMYQSAHSRLDFSLTPNHRMYVRKWDEQKRTLSHRFDFTEMQHLGWYAGLPATTSGFTGVTLDALTIGNRVYHGDDFIALLALIASDGWVGGTEANWNAVSFCCFREDRRAMVEALSYRLGIKEVPDRCGVWKFSDGALADWLRGHLFVGDSYKSPFKKIPSIVKEVSKRQVEHFLSFFGDQHTGSGGRSRQFYSASRAMIDGLQELLLRTGKRSSIYERLPRTTHMQDGRIIHAENCTADLTLTESDTQRLSVERKKQVGTDRYNGTVFCATVPNGLILTRRNGSILISGNSCTAHGALAALEFERRKDRGAASDFMPSRLFEYFNTRLMEGTANYDSGASVRDAVKSMAYYGVLHETDWPYDINTFARRPTAQMYADAKGCVVQTYRQVRQTLSYLRGALASNFVVVFGFSVYESFESDDVANTGMVPMPNMQTEAMVGGHCVALVGYDDVNRLFKVRNSWGAKWGDLGHCYMPYAFLLDKNLCSDLWKVDVISS